VTERATGEPWGRVGAWTYGAIVVAVAGGLAVTIRPVLSPFVLYAILLYVVWPRLGVPVYARITVAATGLMGLWLLEATGLLLAPFILALILAYVLDPLVDLLERWMPRSAAIGMLAIPLAGAIAVLALVVMPSVVRQVSQLLANVPGYIAEVEGWLSNLRAWLIGLQIEGVNDDTVPELRDVDAQAVVTYLRNRWSELADRGLGAVLGIGRGIGAVLGLAGYLVLLPILTYYLLRDWDRLRSRLADLIPPSRRESVLEFVGNYDRLLNRFLRGQLLLAAVVGLIVGVGFWIVGFPYSLLLGLLAGVLNVVPYLGLVVSISVAILIAIFSGAILTSLGKVAIVFGVEQVLENILGPRIVGESVGLHPVWVILALALFSFFFGFVGLLLAVPAAVLVKLSVEVAVRRYENSAWYLKGRLPGGPRASESEAGDTSQAGDGPGAGGASQADEAPGSG